MCIRDSVSAARVRAESDGQRTAAPPKITLARRLQAAGAAGWDNIMGRGNPGEAMEPHSIVVISLQNPKEKLWGELLDVTNAGVTVRGIDLSSFDDFVSQVLHPDGDLSLIHI